MPYQWLYVLPGIKTARQRLRYFILQTHVSSRIIFRGSVSELYKAQVNRGERPQMFHYRESRGPEIDVLVNQGECLHERFYLSFSSS